MRCSKCDCWRCAMMAVATPETGKIDGVEAEFDDEKAIPE
jgi:hypothetical protein